MKSLYAVGGLEKVARPHRGGGLLHLRLRARPQVHLHRHQASCPLATGSSRERGRAAWRFAATGTCPSTTIAAAPRQRLARGAGRRDGGSRETAAGCRRAPGGLSVGGDRFERRGGHDASHGRRGHPHLFHRIRRAPIRRVGASRTWCRSTSAPTTSRSGSRSGTSVSWTLWPASTTSPTRTVRRCRPTGYASSLANT